MSKRRHNLSIDQNSHTSKRLNQPMLADPPKKQVSPFKKVSEIPNIKSYVAIEKLRLGKQTLQKIKESLYIDHISERNFQQRIKNNQYYINYERNPFVNKTEKEHNPDIALLPQKKKNLAVKSNTIIESINNLKNKSEYKEIVNKLVKEESQSNYIHKIMKDKRREEEKAIKKKRFQEKDASIYQQMNGNNKPKMNDFQDFERIVNIKEQSFYKRENRKRANTFNIFKILTDDTDSSFYLSSSILKKVYFCEDSTVTKANAKKITNVFKDISFISRLFINNLGYLVPKDYKMVTADLKTVVDQILFSDFMLLSSGFIEPEVLESFLFQEVKNNKRGGGDQEGTSFVDEQDQVCYLDNQVNASALFEVERHEKAQIQTYIDHPLSRIQNKQLDLSEMYKNKLLKYLDLEQNCKRVNVHDKQVLRQINQKKREILLQQFEGQIRNQNGSIDKVIRLNKRKKDRIENIKNKVVIQTIQEQKSIQKKIRSSSKHNKSWSVWR